MKRTRRILALALCLILALTMTTTAFATGTLGAAHSHEITILNTVEGYEYTAYQIFSGTLGTDGVLSNIAWGAGVDGDALLAELKTTEPFAACTDAKQVAAKLAGYGAMDDPGAIAFAEIAAKHVKTEQYSGISEYDTNKKQYTIDGLPDGYYLVINNKVPEGTDTTYSRYIMEVVRDITVTHKGTYPTVEKDIVEGTSLVNVNEASIGETINYQITGTLPSNIGDYDTYYYLFTDTLSKGLTYHDDMKVELVQGDVRVDVTEYFYIGHSVYSVTDGTTIQVGIVDLLTLDNDVDESTEGHQFLADGMGYITKDTKIVLTYSAELNEHAVIAGPNPNTVDLVYSNDPNNDGDGDYGPPPPPPEEEFPKPPVPVGETPESVVNSYTTELTILKKNGQGEALSGAMFSLTGTAVHTMIVEGQHFVEVAEGEGTYWLLTDGHYTTEAPVTEPEELSNLDHYVYADARFVKQDYVVLDGQETDVVVQAFVGEDGYLTFTGLGAGTYTLTEVITPVGFNTIEPITFTVTFDPNTGKFACDDSSLIMVNSDNYLYAEIINVAGTVLPSTGGIGTTLFYVFGGIMVLGAVVLLVTKKRMLSAE